LTTDLFAAVEPRRFVAARVVWLGLLLALPVRAVAAEPALRVLDVPFVSQTEDLCGGAAAAMVLRFWGVRGVDAESFTHLVDHRAGGIRTTDLIRDLDSRGWAAVAVRVEARLADGQPQRTTGGVDRDQPGAYHYVVVVGAPERGFIFHDRASSYVHRAVSSLARWRRRDVDGPGGAMTRGIGPAPPVTTVADARPVPGRTLRRWWRTACSRRR
jgi:hypothetical protein